MKKHSQNCVYIIHGWVVDPANETKWQEFRDNLAELGISSRFLGLPGLTVQLDEVWGLNQYVAWLGKQLPDTPVVLLGHSFGGQIAVRFAAQHPDRVDTLVLIASSGIRDRRWRARLKRAVFFVIAKVGKVFGAWSALRSLFYRLAGEKDYYQAPALLRKTMTRVIGDEIVKDLPRVTAQTLLIWGKNDAVTPLRNTTIYKTIPNSRLSVIEDARHSPQFTHPEEVAALVAAFLKEKSPV